MTLMWRRFCIFPAVILTTLIFIDGSAGAALGLAPYFSDHAVIQADKPVMIWGTATQDELLTVTLGKESRRGSSGSDGTWIVAFPPRKASYDEATLQVTSGKESLERKGILFGEVWVATGQSNMLFMLKQASGGRQEMTTCADPKLRFVNNQGSLNPGGKKYSRAFLTKLNAENYYQNAGWQNCEPQSAGDFSAVAYYFAKELRKKLDVPVGIIALPVGGSPIEAHMPRDAFEADPVLKPLLNEWWKNPDYPQWCRERAALNLANWLANPVKGQDPPHPFAPTFLWQAGIEPLLKSHIRGIIWYQGESNATVDGAAGAPVAKKVNRHKLVALIEAYRRHWNDEGLPFYHVQLPGLNRPWALFREMQLDVTQELKNVGLAISIDLGHPTDVHPPNKKPVGERLARLALHGTYGQDLVPNGPVFKRCVFKDGQAVLAFENAVGLQSADGGAFTGFEIAGKDHLFYPAEAKVVGTYLEVHSAKVDQALAVRYAWANDPIGNLINGEKLPASPFRTDDWENIKLSSQK